MAKPDKTENSETASIQHPWAQAEIEFLRDCLSRKDECIFLISLEFNGAFGERQIMEDEVFRLSRWIRKWPCIAQGQGKPRQSPMIIGGPLYPRVKPEVEAYAIFLRVARGDRSPQQVMELLDTYSPANEKIELVAILSVNRIARRFINFLDSPDRLAVEKLSAEIVALRTRVDSVPSTSSAKVAALAASISRVEKRAEKFKGSFWFKELALLEGSMTSYRKLVDGLGELATEDLYTLPRDRSNAD